MLLHDEQQRAIEEILGSFDGQMEQVLKDVERLLNKYMLSTPMNATSALAFDMEFNRILQEAGYYNLVNKMIDTDYDSIFSMILDGFSAGGLTSQYSAESLKRVMALKALQVDQFAMMGSTAGATLKENLFKYAISNYSLEDIQKQLLVDFQGTNLARHSKTLANTAIKEFQESIIDIGAEGLDGVWLYVGVKDSKNRDFCRCVLNKKHYYNDAQKNKLRYSPERRYNCRHRFRMVSQEYATTGGYSKSTGSLC